MTGEAAAHRRPVSPRWRILYLSHVDWDWAKQRPQFLAEALFASHDVLALYPYSWRRDALSRSRSPVPRRALPQLPMRRLPGVSACSRALQRTLVAMAGAQFRPDVLWVTHPRLARLLPRVSTARVVYDCMDDAQAFVPVAGAGEDLAALESELLRRADVVLASSEPLVEKLRTAGCEARRIALVRNAFGGEPLDEPLPARSRAPGDPLRLGYVGTIAEWMDLDALAAALDALPSLEVHLVGPCEVPVPARPRMVAHGPLPHEQLTTFAKEMDAMAVPFRRSPLIESVDPVKIYEYVNWGRAIVSRRWPEVERHAGFVYFYDSPAELIATLRILDAGAVPQYTAAQRIEFLRENGWPARAACVEAALRRAGIPGQTR